MEEADDQESATMEAGEGPATVFDAAANSTDPKTELDIEGLDDTEEDLEQDAARDEGETAPEPRPKSTTAISSAESFLQPGSVVAVLCQVDEDSRHEEWMMAVARRYIPAPVSMFEVEDCELDPSNAEFGLGSSGILMPSAGQGRLRQALLSNIIVLPSTDEEALERHAEFKPKSSVLALFPGTTCLYPAFVISNPARRRKTKDYLLRFQDDEVSSRACAPRFVVQNPGRLSH